MDLVRVCKTKNYTVMSNTHFCEKEMSLKSKGLLSLMLSLPDNWDCSIAGLTTLSKDGKDSVMGALNELERFGYLKRARIINEKGQFSGYDYIVYEQPQNRNPNTENPNTENPNTENPNTENPPQLNTNIPNTKKQSTKELNTKELKEKCKKENPEVLDIIGFWNERSVSDKCVVTEKNIGFVKRALQQYSADDIKTAIDRYKKVINDTNYYYNYSWKLGEFLTRKNGIPDFLDDGSKWKNYLADKNKKKTATRPTASPDSEEAQNEFIEELKRYNIM